MFIPMIIEAILEKYPDIIEAAVIDIPDERTGELVKAFITSSNPNLSSDHILKHCKENLIAYKVPKFIEILNELPKLTVGKPVCGTSTNATTTKISLRLKSLRHLSLVQKPSIHGFYFCNSYLPNCITKL